VTEDFTNGGYVASRCEDPAGFVAVGDRVLKGSPCPANPVPSAESGSLTGQPSHGPAPVDYLTPLIAALQDQTAALNRLASSNESLSQAVQSLIDEMASADEQDSDAEPGTYLDGSKVR